ncbi:hypothetical protein L3X38_027283 [Prunus dulcis]|uniref:DNA topoisomerase (ATP-hydrolyzing) n=1 Tax=Prunus dulcis TaxID=3755 RepID=A0AAD4VQ67_PRUDU|nr:hypothetical protein L3X38_027283 [Prunus dulcis]
MSVHLPFLINNKGIENQRFVDVMLSNYQPHNDINRQLNSIINVQEIYARYQLLNAWFAESVSDVLLSVLVIVQQLLQENRHGFKRDIYYMHPSVFSGVPEILWLGAFHLDSEKYRLPQQCLLPLIAEDKRKTEAMLRRCYLQREVPKWRLELQLMLERALKFELEALSVHEL